MNIQHSIKCLVALSLSVAVTAASATTVHEKTLDNGLKVVVKQDHRAPVATSQVWYKVGSADEYGGITGISHALEHMMFKGTEKYGVGEFSEILAGIGARDNAFTGQDYTGYFQLLGADKIETSFKLESDRMANLKLDKKEFVKEIEVVKEERRLRTEDNPNALTYEQLLAAAFTSSPYGHPIVGWMDDLDHMTVEDLADWYDAWYGPNNATLVIVGDVEAEEIFALAEKYYGDLPKREIRPKRSRVEPEQLGERRVEVQAVAKLPYVLIGYKVPSLSTIEDPKEAYALAVLAGVLDGGDSARLSKKLIREQKLAASAGAGYDLYAARNDLFLLDGTPSADHTIGDLEKALMAEVELLKTTLASEEELARIKAQVIASEVYQQDSIQRQAMIIGSLETVGLGWQTMQTFSENINRVTAQQVQDVAKKYLLDKRKTVAILKPLSPTAQLTKK